MKYDHLTVFDHFCQAYKLRRSFFLNDGRVRCDIETGGRVVKIITGMLGPNTDRSASDLSEETDIIFICVYLI